MALWDEIDDISFIITYIYYCCAGNSRLLVFCTPSASKVTSTYYYNYFFYFTALSPSCFCVYRCSTCLYHFYSSLYPSIIWIFPTLNYCIITVIFWQCFLFIIVPVSSPLLIQYFNYYCYYWYYAPFWKRSFIDTIIKVMKIAALNLLFLIQFSHSFIINAGVLVIIAQSFV